VRGQRGSGEEGLSEHIEGYLVANQEEILEDDLVLESVAGLVVDGEMAHLDHHGHQSVDVKDRHCCLDLAGMLLELLQTRAWWRTLLVVLKGLLRAIANAIRLASTLHASTTCLGNGLGPSLIIY
jgi:hypothetical protein